MPLQLRYFFSLIRSQQRLVGFLVIMGCLGSGLYATDSASYSGNFKTAIMHLDDPENTPFYVTSVTYSSDIPFTDYEFEYLTQIKKDTFVTKKQIDRAFRQLMLKKRFSTIAIDMSDQGTGKHFHFTLTANWIFKKLEVLGIWFGRLKYGALYAQQPGDVFDANAHTQSLKEIQKYLYDQGFFSATVTDQLVYSQKYKTIKTILKINRKARFRIVNVTMDVTDLKGYQNDSLKKIKKILRSNLSKMREILNGSYYSRVLVTRQAKKMKEHFVKEGFVNVRIKLIKQANTSKSTITLVLKIQLGRQKIITFEGNTVFSDDYIREELIGQELPDWLFAPDIMSQHLLHEYYKKGYWKTSITPEVIGKSGYHFVIDEGQPVNIERADIIDIHTHLPERATTFLNDFLKGRQCDQTLLDHGLDKLKNYYIENGFWDFKIVDKRFIKNKETGLYRVKISTDRGRQRLWAGFDVQGFEAAETQDFFKRFPRQVTHQKIPFNFHWLTDQRDFLINYFHKLDYWYVDVQPDLRVVTDSTDKDALPTAPIKMFIHWQVKAGPQVKFGNIIMRGATTVPFERIKKQLTIKEGDVFDRKKLDLVRKKLRRLDVFKSVQVQPYQVSKNKEKKSIIVTLADDDPYEVRARAGYFLTSHNFLFKQESTPNVGGSFIVKNITNRADRLAFNADWTKFERTVALDYQQPSLFGMSLLSKAKIYLNKYIHPVRILQSDSAYEAFQNGFLLGLSDEYKDSYYWGINVGNEWIKIARVRGNLKLDQILIDTTLPYFYVEPKLIIDKLDDRVNTTQGYLTSLSLKCMLPEDHGEIMAKLLAEQSFFYPIDNNGLVLAMRARLGYIFNRKFEKVLPNERFCLGGPYSVRGYEWDALPPLGLSTQVVNGKTITNYTIQGGSAMLNGNLELRFPVYKGFGGVLFQDIGILSQSGFLGFKGSWYPGTGVGFRYKTPIGSLRFDFGWKWKRRIPHDKHFAWYLTFGEAF